ncbi:hypothetical protein AB0C96_40920 [Streptomyces sp. NPDC048506]|uniref:hypothetical protein n=1 Tax=Streptomyces sp. NPDC048506 TaxID=3155028 RepID=UPI0034495800
MASSSRIHDAFTKPRLPGWGLLEVLVAELASRVPGGLPVEHEVKRFHNLWDAAAAEDLSGSATALDAALKAALDSSNLSEAIRLGTQLLASSTLAQDHPQNLQRRHQLADCRGEAGEAAEAAAAFTDLVQDRTHVQGPDHPDTLDARHNAAHWRGEAGETAEAAATFPELVQDLTRVQGADHSNTLKAREALAHWRGAAGDAAGAAVALTDLVKDRTRVQGPDHPDTLASQKVLLFWRGRNYLRSSSPTQPHAPI